MHMNAGAAPALLEPPRPDINELEDIVGDILQDDRRATEGIRCVRGILKKAPSGGSDCLGSRFLLRDRQLTIVSFEKTARLAQLVPLRNYEGQ
jgi:hypothetical protein